MLPYSAVMSEPLTKVDSAIAISPRDEKAPDKDAKKGHRRTSSHAEGVYNIKELGESFLSSSFLRRAYIIVFQEVRTC